MRLYGPAQPTTSDTVLYTAPSATWITHIWAANTSGSAATLTLDVNTAGVAYRLVPTISIPANTVFVIEGRYYLDAAEIIRGLQGTSGAITVHIIGETA